MDEKAVIASAERVSDLRGEDIGMFASRKVVYFREDYIRTPQGKL